jgi:hypothetical protein
MTRSLAITLTAVVLAAAPAAAAQTAVDPTPTRLYRDLRSPDARDAARLALLEQANKQPRQDLRSPDARDAARAAAGIQVGVPVKVAEPAPAAAGFDWGSAMLGAAAAFGLALLLGALIALIANRPAVRLGRGG